MKITDDILRVKQEVEAEFFGADQDWNRVENNVSYFCPTECFLLENRRCICTL